MSESERSSTLKVEAALIKASQEVVRKARETGTPILVWEDGRIVRLSPDTLEPIDPACEPALAPSDERG